MTYAWCWCATALYTYIRIFLASTILENWNEWIGFQESSWSMLCCCSCLSFPSDDMLLFSLSLLTCANVGGAGTSPIFSFLCAYYLSLTICMIYPPPPCISSRSVLWMKQLNNVSSMPSTRLIGLMSAKMASFGPPHFWMWNLTTCLYYHRSFLPSLAAALATRERQLESAMSEMTELKEYIQR